MTNSGSDIITILKEQNICEILSLSLSICLSQSLSLSLTCGFFFTGLTTGVSLLLLFTYLLMAYIIYRPYKGPAQSPPRTPMLWKQCRSSYQFQIDATWESSKWTSSDWTRNTFEKNSLCIERKTNLQRFFIIVIIVYTCMSIKKIVHIVMRLC